MGPHFFWVFFNGGVHPPQQGPHFKMGSHDPPEEAISEPSVYPLVS